MRAQTRELLFSEACTCILLVQKLKNKLFCSDLLVIQFGNNIHTFWDYWKLLKLLIVIFFFFASFNSFENKQNIYSNYRKIYQIIFHLFVEKGKLVQAGHLYAFFFVVCFTTLKTDTSRQAKSIDWDISIFMRMTWL